MGDQDAFERTLASLHDAMLDNARWPGASALIDEACGLTGNDLIVSIPPTSAYRASAGCPTVVSYTSRTCSRPRS